jgi:hypothetical protein
MHELLDKYEEAIRTCSSTVFNINDFQSIRLPIWGNNQAVVLETLIEFQRSMELIKIQNGKVTLTIKGWIRSKGARKEWD